MGAGILPTTIHNNKIYFLFGKENKFADTPGWSDFGGGTETSESLLDTATREGGEELTGFLGSSKEIKRLLEKNGIYNIDTENGYRIHLFPMKYTEELPHYYNNNQQFIQKNLDENIIKNTKIFEKEEIQWIPIDELLKKKAIFRSYFQKNLPILVKKKNEILNFVKKALENYKKNSLHRYIMSSRKGTRSKTHRGRKNYTTKRGDKVFHRKGKYVRSTRRPYTKKRRH
jgi:8-oxo-dGTP pyrophosphatase MutT (NUDIX family)